MALDAVDLVRLCFLGATAAVLLLYPIPYLRVRFLSYGARSTPPSSAEQEKTSAPRQRGADHLLDRLAAVRVPHSWFTSFYITSVTMSLVWATDYLLSSPISRHITPYISPSRPSTTFHQALLTYLAVLGQGSRRLYESHVFASTSTSQMWVGHWLLGIFFYATLSAAVWIESTPALRAHRFSPADLSIQLPSLRSLLSITLFTFASGVQHDCHAYLLALKTQPFSTLHPYLPAPPSPTDPYKLPQHPAFHRSLTPHYLAECLIYVSLCLMAAPQGCWVNWTMVCALLFVAGNLAVTAQGTYEWYAQKFGREALEGRARMVPFVF